MRQYILAFLLIAFSGSLLQANDTTSDSYRKGFQEGTKALENQFKAQGWRQKEIIFKNYIVALPIAKLAINDVAYICELSRNLGYKPVVTQNIIVFNDYERSADAEYNSSYINKKLKIKTYGQNAKGKIFYTYPLFKTIYKSMEEDIISKNDVLVVTNYTNKIKYVKSKCPKIKPRGKKVTYFRIKTKIAQGYTLDKNYVKAKKINQKFMLPTRIFRDVDQLYKKGRIITTSDNKKYIKVYNTNLYFSAKNVKIMNIYI